MFGFQFSTNEIKTAFLKAYFGKGNRRRFTEKGNQFSKKFVRHSAIVMKHKIILLFLYHISKNQAQKIDLAEYKSIFILLLD